MRNNYKEIQVIEISIDELFCWQDKLDAIEDTPEKAWDLFNNFLNECESQLDLSDELLEKLNELEELNEQDNENVEEELIEDIFEEGVDKNNPLQFRPRLNF